MNDIKPFKHGDEGDGSTHHACQEMIEKFGDKAVCCSCNGHECQPNTEKGKGDVTEDWKGNSRSDDYLDELWFNAKNGGNPNSQLQGWDKETWIKAANAHISKLLANQRQEIVEEIREIENPFEKGFAPHHHSAETMKYLIIDSLKEKE